VQQTPAALMETRIVTGKKRGLNQTLGLFTDFVATSSHSADMLDCLLKEIA
jgi:hypothetical protein